LARASFGERSEFGAQMRARPQFQPALHRHTRRFFLTLRFIGCQL
jgi:hypothetical protein